MKKYIYLIITILVSLILGVFYIDAFLNVNFIMDNSNIIPIILLITLGVLLAYILYDLGHLLFTKIGKYKVISFRILNSNFYIKDGKMHRFTSLYKDHFHPIVIGSDKENNHYNLYYLGGCFMNLLVGFIVQLTLIFVKNDTLLTLLLICFGFVNVVYALINALPLSFLYNDGYFLYNLVKQPASIQAFHQKNALNNKLIIGKNFDELNFSVYSIDNLHNDYNDPIILEYKELETYHYMYKLYFKEALETVEYVLSKSNKMLKLYKKTFTNLRLILLILTKNDDKALELYLSLNDKQKNYVCKCKTLDDTILALLISIHINKDTEKVKLYTNKLKDYINNTPYSGEKEPLNGLLEHILNNK